MPRPTQQIDWHQLVGDSADAPVASTRDRLPWVMVFFAVALFTIFARAVQLELTGGPRFRELAARPVEKSVALRAERGPILARDSTALAADRKTMSLAVEFRYLETPSNPEWFRRQVRARLSRTERRQPERVAAMEQTVRDELAALRQQLARMCNLSDAQWTARSNRIQRRVTSLAAHVNARRLDKYHDRLAAEPTDTGFDLQTVLTGLFAPPESLPPPPVVVAEQLAFHRLADDIAPDVVAEIESQPKKYPGVKILETVRRDYPRGSLAANLVGHVGKNSAVTTVATPADRAAEGDEAIGLMGLERVCESTLRGESGLERQETDRRGKLLASHVERAPRLGRQVMLTIDAALQAAAEQLLDRALRRQQRADDAGDAPHGGAIVVMDIHTGELLAAASAPRFDPNWFVDGDPRLDAVLADARQPLFDRVTKMALPPGSVFKPLTALALLESKIVRPETAFACQGYLTDPDRQRCQLFRQQGIGHGELTLADALGQSCNVYFFHHAAQLGSVALVDWLGRFGFGQPTGIDLPDESPGRVPTVEQLRQLSETQALSIGQGAFTATPLQVVRMYAAIANGGFLITPRLLRPTDDASTELSDTQRIAGLSVESLQAVREGLRRVVEDPNGTAHTTVRLASLTVAGKTGTAETGGRQQDHAWFAGFAPADSPKFAFVVVLEHAGSGATVAGSVAKNLLQRMQQLDYFGPPARVQPETAENTIPPGKG